MDYPYFLKINVDNIALSDTTDIPIEKKIEIGKLSKKSLGSQNNQTMTMMMRLPVLRVGCSI